MATTNISNIQGSSLTSPIEGESVTTTGIVTAVDSNGFYLQDPSGDGSEATSDGIFVFTGSEPSISTGDELEVQGEVTEFIPGGEDTGNLATTEITSPSITTLSTGNALPNAVLLGEERTLPTEIIDNDDLTEYEPSEDAIDFYESLEGMRVTADDAKAVSPTNRFGEIYTVANNGANATGLSDRGTISISPDDFNPERIQIQLDDGILPEFSEQVDVGAQVGDVTGVVGYSFGYFEVNATEPFTPTESELQREETNLGGAKDQLTVASYNVLNLDPNDEDGDMDVANGKFEQIANQVVNNLETPDVIGLQEIQDNDGSVDSEVVDASKTYQTLINEIVEAGGPRYDFKEIPPVDDQSGGQPGGNIRVSYLHNPKQAKFVKGSLERIEDPEGDAFQDSRNPLAATFRFKGREVTLINNHFTSKGGSDPLFGRIQPPEDGGLEQRIAQAEVVNDYANDILATDSDANVAVLGDFNAFEFERPLEILEGDNFTNLTETLPPNERYSYIFQGNSQSLDHILVSDSLNESAEFDAVHLNTEFTDQASDHDPLLTSLDLLDLPAEKNVGKDIPANTKGVTDFTPGADSLDFSQA
ncbi:MAG: nuclease [Cyanobacteria bacterium QH_2_48_84]|nr:MAG: nuclease [Cyanobacteria bacterium QH_2_48_84]